MTACVGFTGWLFGHKYEGRWSESSDKAAHGPNGQWTRYEGVAATERAKARDVETRVYHGDVCVRCGGVVNRPAAAGAARGA